MFLAVLLHARCDLVVGEIASIVQPRDIQEQLDDHASPPTGKRGFSLITKDDHETVERAAVVHDALLRVYGQSLSVS